MKKKNSAKEYSKGSSSKKGSEGSAFKDPLKTEGMGLDKSKQVKLYRD